MIDLLSRHPDAFIACALILGLLVGSFINVLAWRLPKMLEQEWQAQAREVLDLPEPAKGPVYNLMLPRSHCPHCQHKAKMQAKETLRPAASALCWKTGCKAPR